MKTIYTLTLLVLLGPNLFAQGNKYKPHNPTNTSIVKPLYDSIDEWFIFIPSTPTPAVYKYTDYNYDINGNLLSDVLQMSEVNMSKVIYTYLPNNLPSTSISQNWSGNNWLNSSDTIYTYVANTYPDSTIGQQWKNNAWADTTLIYYQYNSNNLDSCKTYQLWTGSSWINNYRYLYFYNSDSIDTCTIQQNWNGSSWVNKTKNSTYYNSKKFDTLDIDFTWIDTAASWGNNDKARRIPNINSLDSVDIIMLGSLNYWGNPLEEITYTYDANNNLIHYLADNYPGSSGVLFVNVIYAYDANNMLLSKMTTSDPFDNQDSTHYYFHQTVGINNISSLVSLPIYPNPSALNFTVDNGSKSYTNCSINIYNMLGQDVYKTTWSNFNSPTQISLNDPNGIYILRFSSDQGTFYRKLEIKN